MNSQGNTEKQSNRGGVPMPNFTLYYRAIAIKKNGTGKKKEKR
jgi:hypothetical protein